MYITKIDKMESSEYTRKCWREKRKKKEQMGQMETNGKILD